MNITNEPISPNEPVSGRSAVPTITNEPSDDRDEIVTAKDTTASSSRRGTLTTADLAASANKPERLAEEREERAALRSNGESDAGETTQRETAELAALFDEHLASDFRSRWSVVQQGFVDDPQKAVKDGDELVAQVIKSLAETFAKQRAAVEGKAGSTEELRLALRRYRSFFERLLTA